VRSPSWCLLAIFLGLGIQTLGQSVPQDAPAPRSADAAPMTLVPNLPVASATSLMPQVDPLELQREAKQILELSKSIPSDVEYINHGLLPRDTIEKLKRIERLSKQLRSQIGR
jgi:hypothetical protein